MAEECRICHSNISLPAWTLCGHCFCDPCIRLHVTRIPKCPVCEGVVLTEDLSSTPRRSDSGTAIGGGEGSDATPNRSTPTAPYASTLSHAPVVASCGLPPDGPPPYSSSPQRVRIRMISFEDLQETSNYKMWRAPPTAKMGYGTGRDLKFGMDGWDEFRTRHI